MTADRPRTFITMPQGFDRASGLARIRGEEVRLSGIKAAAAPHFACGPDVVASPARGAYKVTNPIGLVPRGVDGWEAQPVGYRGRSVLQRADVFDKMNADARVHGGTLFSEGQMWVARLYWDLTERRQSGGVKLSSLEGRVGSAGEGGDFMDAFIADGITLQRLDMRVGSGVAMAIRRIRPSARAEGAMGKRRIISDRALVAHMCLADETPSEVLRAYGWSIKVQYREAVRGALAACLDRMQGVKVVVGAK